MKRKILKIGISVSLLAFAVVGVEINGSNDGIVNLTHENIEALAFDEEEREYRICYSESIVKKGYTYYDCGSCEKIYDEKGKGQYSKCFK